jgi:AcrR family transcriptional regulator
MSPRAYRLGLREAAMEATRDRIIEAACQLLTSGGFGVFTIDTVARAADVSRMTVYNQFGSKAGLLEAIFDWVAQRGGVRRLGDAASHPDPEQGLTEFVHGCCALWATNRQVHRRLVGLAAIDLDFEAALQGRERRRSDPVRTLLTRLSERDGRPAPGQLESAVLRVAAVSSFASVDGLAGAQDPAEVADLVGALVRRVLDNLTQV